MAMSEPSTVRKEVRVLLHICRRLRLEVLQQQHRQAYGAYLYSSLSCIKICCSTQQLIMGITHVVNEMLIAVWISSCTLSDWRGSIVIKVDLWVCAHPMWLHI